MSHGSRIDQRAAYLLPYLSPITYGKKTEAGPRPKLTMVRANDYLAQGWSGKISGRKVVQHFHGTATHYYWADLSSPSLLMMGDVDCHDSGSLEGAMAFCKFLSDTLLPGLYYEPSTNGNGAHFYFDIANAGLKLTRKDVCKLAARLAEKFNELAKDFDVQMVEIKGHPPEVTPRRFERAAHGYRVVPAQVVTYGQFAKLPRLSTDERFEQFKNRPVLTPDVINSELFDVVPEESVDSVTPSATRTAAGSCVWVTEDDQRMLDNLTAWCKGQDLHNLKTSSRHVVEARDFAIAMLVVKKLSEVMEDGDPMRTKRIWGVWDSFYQNGYVDRAFDPKRWKVIRNTLSERGLLDWRDNSYVVPLHGEGRAMDWRMGPELLAVMDEMAACKDLEEATLLGTQELLVGRGEVCYPEIRYGEVIPMPPDWQTRLEQYDFWSSPSLVA
jgi:hypothetical protein